MYCLVFSTIMIKSSYSWYLTLLNYSILLIRHDNYNICIINTLNNHEQGKCRLRLKLFCNFILSERINKVYIYNITAFMFNESKFLFYLFFIIYLFRLYAFFGYFIFLGDSCNFKTAVNTNSLCRDYVLFSNLLNI